MDPERKGYLLVVEEEAAIVRDLFKTFLEEGVVSIAGKKSMKTRLYSKSARQVVHARASVILPLEICIGF
jgi:HD superfamily phosphohydrolase YqeK